MCRGRRCWGLGSVLLLLLLLLGQNLGLLIEIPQDAVSGTVGQSVLLPVSYRVNSSFLFPMSIAWKFGNISQVIITCTVQNCSLDAEGAPRKCSAISFPRATHRDRTEVFPENASLLLRDLQLSDSGVYSVTFTQQNQSRRITLAVHKQRVSPEHPDKAGTEGQGISPYYIIGVCSLIGLFLLFLVLCIWQRGAVWRKIRTMTRQQASDTEDIHMENTVVGDVSTVYATIEDFEETKPRALPETLYTSVTFPQLPSASAPNYARDRSAAEPR